MNNEKIKGHKFIEEDVDNNSFCEELSLFYLLSKKFIEDYQEYTMNNKHDNYNYLLKIPKERFKNDTKYLRRILNELSKKVDKINYEYRT